MTDVLIGFIPDFALGLLANMQMALASLAIGVGLGAPLALAHRGPWAIRASASAAIALLRAAPTFVLIFFLLNALGSWRLGPWTFVITAWDSVVLALGCYATAYVSDNTLETLRQRAAGQAHPWPLLLTALVRAFFVMVLSSGFAAAVGVQEAVSTTMRAVERLPDLSDKLMLVVVVMAFFTAVFQIIYAAVRFAQARFTRAPSIS